MVPVGHEDLHATTGGIVRDTTTIDNDSDPWVIKDTDTASTVEGYSCEPV